MCHPSVMQAVARRMLGRRTLDRRAFVAGAAAAVSVPGAAASAPAPARPFRVEDLTHTLSPDFPTFAGTPALAMRRTLALDRGANMFELTLGEHVGTHIDAPLHFADGGLSVDALPIGELVVPLSVVDIRARAGGVAGDADALLTPGDLDAWRRAHGDFPPGGAVAMLSGWAEHLGSPRYRNVGPGGFMHFPGFHSEAAAMLLETSSVGIAVDTLSLDRGDSVDLPVHVAWLAAGRWGLENVANLDRLPPTGATLVVGAPKIRGGTGGPARVLALL